MIVAVVGKRISIAGDLDDYVLKGRGVAPDHEKGRVCLVFSQNSQHLGRPDGIGAVIEGEVGLLFWISSG